MKEGTCFMWNSDGVFQFYDLVNNYVKKLIGVSNGYNINNDRK